MSYHDGPTSASTIAASSTSPSSSSYFASLTLDHTLEDLCARFIVNLPTEELVSMDRICFQIEQAHWYYEDFVRPSALNPLPSYSLKAFSLLMFRSCALLHDASRLALSSIDERPFLTATSFPDGPQLIPSHQQIWTSFMAYKERVPVCGAILISQYWDKVLLVKGWNKGASWSFPRGKINKGEPEGMCAVREVSSYTSRWIRTNVSGAKSGAYSPNRQVLEETGYDLSSAFPPEQLQTNYVEQEPAERVPYYVELVIKEQKIRLYLIPGIHEDTYFETRTRKEISKIDWFKLSDLPTWQKDKKGKKNASQIEGKQAKFYMVTPFMSHLKLWIERNKPKNVRKRAPVSAIPIAPAPTSRAVIDSEPEHELSTSPSGFGSTTEDDDLTDLEVYSASAPLAAKKFESTQEATDALNAFFFGGSPPKESAVQQPPPPPLPSTFPPFQSVAQSAEAREESPGLSTRERLSSAGTTLPHVAYERQSSFVQPKPQTSTHQTDKLLALLASQTSPPPPPPAKPPLSLPNNKMNLLGILRGQGQSRSVSSPKPNPNLLPDASSPLQTNASPSMLFDNSQPPPEAEGFGVEHVATHAERGQAERQEKRNALLRALSSMAAAPVSHHSPTTPSSTGSVRALFNPASPSRQSTGVTPPVVSSSLANLSLQDDNFDQRGWPITATEKQVTEARIGLGRQGTLMPLEPEESGEERWSSSAGSQARNTKQAFDELDAARDDWIEQGRPVGGVHSPSSEKHAVLHESMPSMEQYSASLPLPLESRLSHHSGSSDGSRRAVGTPHTAISPSKGVNLLSILNGKAPTPTTSLSSATPQAYPQGEAMAQVLPPVSQAYQTAPVSQPPPAVMQQIHLPDLTRPNATPSFGGEALANQIPSQPSLPPVPGGFYAQPSYVVSPHMQHPPQPPPQASHSHFAPGGYYFTPQAPSVPNYQNPYPTAPGSFIPPQQHPPYVQHLSYSNRPPQSMHLQQRPNVGYQYPQHPIQNPQASSFASASFAAPATPSSQSMVPPSSGMYANPTPPTGLRTTAHSGQLLGLLNARS
ncbi:BZ3500_MvSof-1268-A1-R1_Chr3-3g06489 [Microbotryum saponariae]|uniref:BZ3500_MvSof-1268-A1-R1_Chr3-3g06489 protein n=1 Tax=Microbotryum saponariae TaxID=289078 RepID=A0A2X0L0X7_9BASI|nr:BZ3500_MvSof-1268-A1-R1_Chr3-3g06489 [Microbotryum saponariae]SDA04456.1 BZ3501_MvSof-1269-A2-R1_Chr3-2g06176 [Microbotryum saponariae]